MKRLFSERALSERVRLSAKRIKQKQAEAVRVEKGKQKLIWRFILMNKLSVNVVFAIIAVLVTESISYSEQKLIGVPYKPDPPIVVDGDLQDWGQVPNAIREDRLEQVIFGKNKWTGPNDLSGTVHIAWRRDMLFIGAEVTDDVLQQTMRGKDIWRGDHIELYIDVAPEYEPERKTIGKGQFHFGFSPGNFKNTGDALIDCRPEACCFSPSGIHLKGVTVAAKRTLKGYDIEAGIPWELLGVKAAHKGMLIRYEIAISDTDIPEPKQETMMTIGTEQWSRSRSRWRLAILSGTDGIAPELVRSIKIFDNLRIGQGEKKIIEFVVNSIPEGKQAILSLQARLHSKKVAGYTPALIVKLNDKTLTVKRLINKPAKVKTRSGRICSIGAGDRLTTYYTPDFDLPEKDKYYGMLGGIKACYFDFDVSDIIKQGKNVIVIEDAAADTVKNPLIVGNGQVKFRTPPPAPKAKAGPPKGPIPIIEPRADFKTQYSVRLLQNGAIKVSIGGNEFVVESKFSTPKPAWVSGSNKYFTLKRTIERKSEAIIVRDIFRNMTSENIGLMQRHSVKLGGRLKKVWLNGLEYFSKQGRGSDSHNPTTFAATDIYGIGMFPLNDVFRLHITNYAVDGIIGIADNQFILKGNSTYVAEWAIVPVSRPDYWRFVNSARRLVGANFTIDGCFAFLRVGPQTSNWSDETLKRFIKYKDAKYLCAGISYPRYKGRVPQGTAWQSVSHDAFTQALKRRKSLFSDIRNLIYFHCFIDVKDESPDLFADARVLRPDGSQADYGKSYMRIFFPTINNSYGRAIRKNVDIIFKLGADGVYWDEHEYSAYKYHYGKPWDGVSGDIDPRSMKIVRLKSSVTLLSEGWRVSLAKYILSRGYLWGNGTPVTNKMSALKYPCFVETGSISNCARNHLYSPVALGDHLTERTEEDAYGVMLGALDYGCLYVWYFDLPPQMAIPTHYHLTHYMYPCTPMEIHKGYVIGKERIITKESGMFGWGDSSKHEVHAFDDKGREVKDFSAPTITRNGKTYTELRLAEDWSAVIIRK